MILTPGTHKNISNKDYHADTHFISSSRLKEFAKDHYAYRDKYIFGVKDKEPQDTSHFDFGTYVHLALLEPHLLEEEAIILTSPRIHYKTYETYKRFCKDPSLSRGDFLSAKSDYDIFLQEHSNKVIITLDEKRQIDHMVKECLKLKFFQILLNSGDKELTVCSTVRGVPVKCRWDLVGNGYGLDVKTSSFDISGKGAKVTCLKRDYMLSAGHYLDTSNAAGLEIKDFYFLFINKFNGQINLMKAEKSFLKQSKMQFREALAKYKFYDTMGFMDTTSNLEIVESV